MSLREKISAKILEARKHKWMNQQGLATLMGVSQNSVSRWENGEVIPSVEQLEKIAHHTGRPLTWFFEDERKGDVSEEVGMKQILLQLIEGQKKLEGSCERQEALLLDILKSEEAIVALEVIETKQRSLKK